jgi:hypothetical protein
MSERPKLPFLPGGKKPAEDPAELRALMRGGAWLAACWTWIAARPRRLQALIVSIAAIIFFILVGFSEQGTRQQQTAETVRKTPQSQQSVAGSQAARLIDEVRLKLSGARVLQISSQAPAATATIGEGRAMIKTGDGVVFGVDESGIAWTDGGGCWRKGNQQNTIGASELLSMLYSSNSRFAEPEANGDGQRLTYSSDSFGGFDAGGGELIVDANQRLQSVSFKEDKSSQQQNFTVVWPGPNTSAPVFKPVCR